MKAPEITQQSPTFRARLAELLIPHPPPDEQREIISVHDAIDHKIELHRKKRAVLDDLFKVLLYKLMAGEIRVADLDLPHDYARQ